MFVITVISQAIGLWERIEPYICFMLYSTIYRVRDRNIRFFRLKKTSFAVSVTNVISDKEAL